MVVLMAVETHEFLRIAHPRVQDLPATDSFTRKRPSSVIGEKCGLITHGGLSDLTNQIIKVCGTTDSWNVSNNDITMGVEEGGYPMTAGSCEYHSSPMGS